MGDPKEWRLATRTSITAWPLHASILAFAFGFVAGLDANSATSSTTVYSICSPKASVTRWIIGSAARASSSFAVGVLASRDILAAELCPSPVYA